MTQAPIYTFDRTPSPRDLEHVAAATGCNPPEDFRVVKIDEAGAPLWKVYAPEE